MNGGVGGTHNRVDGGAQNVVQAEIVYGGVHFHDSQAGVPTKRVNLLPPRMGAFVNQRQTLTDADRGLPPDGGNAGPRIVVFFGRPGVGRRAIGRTWIELHAADFLDGVFHADLGGEVGPSGLESVVLGEWLLAIGFPASSIPETPAGRLGAFRSWSAGKRIAVMLENVSTATQVRGMTPGPGASVVVATAAGPLTGLGPRSEVTQLEVPPLDDVAALRLLAEWVDRGRLDRDPEAVTTLLRFCGGLSLALCVVGALLEDSLYRRPSDLVAALIDERRRLEVLSVTEDLSVQAVFTAAYDNLSVAGRAGYRALGLHPGPEAVGPAALSAALGLPPDEGRAIAEEMVKRSLAVRVTKAAADEDATGAGEVGSERYTMVELIRVHAQSVAREQLSADEQARIGERFAVYYHDHAVVAGDAMSPGRGWAHLLFARPDLAGRTARQYLGQDPRDWLEAERATLRVCVGTAQRAGQFERVTDLSLMLWPLHEQGRYAEDQIAVNGLGVDAARQLGNVALQALLGIQQGFGHLQLGEAEKARRLFVAALEAARSTFDQALLATALESLALADIVDPSTDRTAEARALLRENLQLAAELGPDRRIALARFHLAKVEQPEPAVDLLRSALATFTDSVADPYNAAKVRSLLGRRLVELGSPVEARVELTAALAELTVLDRPFDRLPVHEALGDLDDLKDSDDDESRADRSRNYEAALVIAGTFGLDRDRQRLQAKLDRLVPPSADGDVDSPPAGAAEPD